MTARILLLEDDESLKLILSRALGSAGYQVRATASPDTALNWIRNGEGDLLLADVLLDGTNFLENLGLVSRLRPQMPVIVMSAQATASTAIDAAKGGVFEYLPKPFDLDDMISAVGAALGDVAKTGRSRMTDEPTGFIGQSSAMQSSFKAIARAATSQAHVMITGEPGVGKRQAAEALLRARGISADDAIVVTPSNTATEIFGSTQAARQVVWLRLEEWNAEQQRAARDALDAGIGRVIATASHSPEAALDTRLVARLSECVITVPPLRERRSDIPALCEAFLGQFARRDKQDVVRLSKDAVQYLQGSAWTGNVVELRSVLSRLSLATRGRVAGLDDVLVAFSADAGDSREDLDVHANAIAALSLTRDNARNVAIDAIDRALFAQALDRCGGNRSRAAELLGLNRNTLARRLAELDGEDADM
ncbi:sigma-54-dependent transcriptional regulator [Maricaulis maris]|uniref:Two-component system nitrogen regulation response regulator GlnG n=1 Tax=Maricaulis maris TaxID=74318 RepID=A0A495DJK3_9PROT|nr:response regulator [Maricaulis maris]RKR02799.1 two-component system nitrogen regulation response regulator GlnG [Maricaulis maris]